MNERIKELAEQAREYASTRDMTGEYLIAFDQDKYSQKFAELIVKECLEVMRLVPYDTDREFGDEVIYQDSVKKHFGVE
jgi:hypothetical protein